jgi:hypothetical protein
MARTWRSWLKPWSGYSRIKVDNVLDSEQADKHRNPSLPSNELTHRAAQRPRRRAAPRGDKARRLHGVSWRQLVRPDYRTDRWRQSLQSLREQRLSV